MTQPTQARPALDSWQSIEGWSTAPSRGRFEEEFNVEGCQAFADAHRENFPFCEAYGEKLREFIHPWPLSRKNLEIAWEALGIGKVMQIEGPREPNVVRLVPVVAAQVAPATEEEFEALEKLKDVPHLHDSQRKIRDSKLRDAAISSRNSHRKHHPSALIG
jgi:hypothetical protein